MSNILTIGYTTEGPTDERFLKSIITKAFEHIAFSCESDIEVFEPVFLKFPRRDGFVNDLVELSTDAYRRGINVLCVHLDSDDASDDNVLKHKINPAFLAVKTREGDTNCKNLVSIIPIHMAEAWILADKDLFRDEIGTTKSLIDLGLNKDPEVIADPKTLIQEALVIAQAHLPKRRNKIVIGDLYQPIGQKLKIEKLEALNSFKNFQSSVIDAFKLLNYLH